MSNLKDLERIEFLRNNKQDFYNRLTLLIQIFECWATLEYLSDNKKIKQLNELLSKLKDVPRPQKDGHKIKGTAHDIAIFLFIENIAKLVKLCISKQCTPEYLYVKVNQEFDFFTNCLLDRIFIYK